MKKKLNPVFIYGTSREGTARLAGRGPLGTAPDINVSVDINRRRFRRARPDSTGRARGDDGRSTAMLPSLTSHHRTGLSVLCVGYHGEHDGAGARGGDELAALRHGDPGASGVGDARHVAELGEVDRA